jgi:hypothetical protein
VIFKNEDEWWGEGNIE